MSFFSFLSGLINKKPQQNQQSSDAGSLQSPIYPTPTGAPIPKPGFFADMSKSLGTYTPPASLMKPSVPKPMDVSHTAKQVGGFFADLARAVPRLAVSAAESAAPGKIQQGNAIGQFDPATQSITPNNVISKFILGDKPIPTFQQKNKNTQSFLDKAQFPGGPLAAPFLVGVGGVLDADVPGFGSAKKEAVDEISHLATNSLKNDLNGVREKSLQYFRENPDQILKEGPVRVREIDGGLHIEDGRHRLEVAREKGLPVDVVDVTPNYGGEKSKVLENILKEKPPTAPTNSTGVKAADEALAGAEKRRRFGITVENSKLTGEELKTAARGSMHNPIANTPTFDEARRLLDHDPVGAAEITNSAEGSALKTAIGITKMIDEQKAGRFDNAIRIYDELAQQLTKQGQAIQAVAAFAKQTPEGVLRYAINVARKTGKPVETIITPKVAEDLVKQAEKLKTIIDPIEHDVEAAVLIQKINDLVPVSIGKKIATVQTIAQLLNPKTIIRNSLGNLVFAGAEQVSDVVGKGFDSALSLITGKRSTALPSLVTQFKGGKRGFKEAIRDISKGIRTGGGATQFDLPQNVFKGGLGAKAEKALNYVLQGPDRALYQAAYDGSLYKQMKAAGVDVATDAMKEVAHYDGLYRTFQDDSVLAKVFTGIKQSLNKVGINGFGLGDFVLKYPKTPANLLSRGLAYSPAGFTRAIYEAAAPLMGKAFNQKRFVESFSRALVGSGALVGTGALLHHYGIITGTKEKDKDIRGIQKLSGMGSYQINVSALKRFVLGGMSPDVAGQQQGDKLVSYDWVQPLAIAVSMGANMDEKDGGPRSALVGLTDSVTKGIDTLAEQPLISNTYKLITNSQSFSDVAKNILAGIPSSFVPTLLNQVRQLSDNTQRNVYTGSVKDRAIALAMNRVPGLEKRIQPAIDQFGNNAEVYQGGSNNIFNVLFNPAFVTHYNPTPEAKMVLDIYKNAAEIKQAPRSEPTSLIINGVNTKLTPTQQTAYQRYVGETTQQMFKRLAENPKFIALPDDKKADYMSSLLSDIASTGKIILLGHRPKKLGDRERQLIQYWKKQNLNEAP